MRICVLEEVKELEDLLCVTLELRKHKPTSYKSPLICIEVLKNSIQNRCKEKFDLLIIGDHPKTSFSWLQVVEQVRSIMPDLPILLISNNGYHETLIIERQLQRLKILDEPFRLNDLYAIVDGFTV